MHDKYVLQLILDNFLPLVVDINTQPIYFFKCLKNIFVSTK